MTNRTESADATSEEDVIPDATEPSWRHVGLYATGVRAFAEMYPTPPSPPNLDLDPRSRAQGMLEGIGLVLASLFSGTRVSESGAIDRLITDVVRPALLEDLTAARAAITRPETPR